jgi:pteridine reductase
MTWAVVTGAAARGGAAICRSLHVAGVDVVIHHSNRSLDRARGLALELEGRRPGSTKLWAAEFTQPVEPPPEVLDLTPAHCVCNASRYEPSSLQDEQRAAEDWAIHVRAHATLLAALRPSLRSVVGISDVHVDQPSSGHLWYTVAKAGLQALILGLAVEWAPAVRCNLVAPGSLPFPEGWQDTVRTDQVLGSIPLGRVGTFEELAEAVRWLTLDASYLTGQVIKLDGGRSRWLA